MGLDERDSKVWEIAIIGLIYFLAIALTEMIAWEMTREYTLGFQLLAGFLLMVAAGGFLIRVYSKITPRVVVSSEGNSDISEMSREQRNPKTLRWLFVGCCGISVLLAGLGIVFLAEPLLQNIPWLADIDQQILRIYVDSPFFAIGSILASVGLSSAIFYVSLTISDSQKEFNDIFDDLSEIKETLKRMPGNSPKK